MLRKQGVESCITEKARIFPVDGVKNDITYQNGFTAITGKTRDGFFLSAFDPESISLSGLPADARKA